MARRIHWALALLTFVQAAPAVARAEARIVSVDVEPGNGRERVVLELDGRADFRVTRPLERTARLEVRGVELDPKVERRIEVSGEIVHGITLERRQGVVVVVVEREPGAIATAIRQGNRIVWMFAPPPRGRGARPRSRTITREPATDLATADAHGLDSTDVTNESGETSEVAGFVSDVPLQVRGTGRRRYSGRLVDLDLKDADIHNILRHLSEAGGVNIITTDEVSGTVTLRLQRVPWDQALEVILQSKGLGMVRRNNMIRVAPLERLEKEREAAIAKLKQDRELEPLETRLVPVSYAGAGNLQPRVKELLTERGTVSVDERTNVLIVRDIGRILDDIEELVRTLDTQTPQVLIEARIVEATSQYSRDVGIQWGGDGQMTTANGNPTGLPFPNDWSVAGGASDSNTPTAGLSPIATVFPGAPNFAVNLPAAVGTGQGGAIGLSLGSLGGGVNVRVRLSAAESKGTVRIISSPRILTLDNHDATIAQGTLIPYSQTSAQGVNTAFQEAKLQLKVRPHVTSDGSVAMHVEITRDEPDFNNTGPRGDPTILKREARTDLLIPDGHTAVIGGIYTRNTGRSTEQIPFFGDIPVLGVLFQRRRVRDDRNELLIFLTPRIVNRAESAMVR